MRALRSGAGALVAGGLAAIGIGAAALILASTGHPRSSSASDPPSLGDPKTTSGIVVYKIPRGMAQGTNFTVEVRRPRGRWQRVQTYDAEVNFQDPANASMAELDAKGPLQVAVTSTAGPMQSAVVRPLPLGIKPTLSANQRTATFTLPKPADLSFEANGDTQHNLQLFVNPIERYPKSRNSRHTMIFRAGVHYIGGGHVLRIPRNTTVEIDGGAVVRGALSITGPNVTLEGHGVIDPSGLFAPGSTSTVLIDGTSNVEVRDLSILESESVGFEIQNSSHVTLSHVREINSAHWSDGVDVNASSDVSIEKAFLRTSDDSIAVYASTPWGANGSTSNVVVRDCTLFPDVAHPVLVGTHGNPNGADTIEHLFFQNLDVLQEDVSNPLYQGVLAVDAGDNNTVSDVDFDNVDVERISEGQLFNVRVFLNPDYNTVPGRSVSDVLFQNVTYAGRNDLPSVIEGYSLTQTVSNVTFQNVSRAGQLALSPRPANIDIGRFTSGISFQQ